MFRNDNRSASAFTKLLKLSHAENNEAQIPPKKWKPKPPKNRRGELRGPLDVPQRKRLRRGVLEAAQTRAARGRVGFARGLFGFGVARAGAPNQVFPVLFFISRPSLCSAAPVGLTDFSQVDVLVVWCTSVNFGGGKLPNW